MEIGRREDAVTDELVLPGSLSARLTAAYLGLVRLAAAYLGERQAAEDAVQDVFVRFYARPPRLANASALDRYLRVSVLNSVRNAARSDGRRRVREAWSSDSPMVGGNAETTVLDDLTRFGVREAVLTLPARQRDVIFLRYLVDLSVAETARTLRISEAAVKMAAARALPKLALTLKELR